AYLRPIVVHQHVHASDAVHRADARTADDDAMTAGGHRHRMAETAASRAIDIRAHLSPHAADEVEHAHVTASVAAAVVQVGSNGDARAVIRNRHGTAEAVVCRFAIDVLAELNPDVPATFEHAS